MTFSGDQGGHPETDPLVDGGLIWHARPNGDRHNFSQGWADFTGQSLARLAGKGWLDHVHPDDKDRVIGALGVGFQTRTPIDLNYRLRRHDGEFRRMTERSVPVFADGSFRGYVGVCNEGTDWQASTAQIDNFDLSEIFEAAPVGIGFRDLRSGAMIANSCLATMLGYDTHSFNSMLWSQVLHPDERTAFVSRLQASATTGEPFTAEQRLLRSDGSQMWAMVRVVFHPLVAPRFALSFVTDITARKDAELAQQRLEGRLRTIIDGLDEGVVALSRDESFGFANPAYNRLLTGQSETPMPFYTLDRARQKFDLIDRRQHRLSDMERPVPRIMRGERVGPEEYHAVFADGRELDVVVRGEPIFNEQGEVDLAILVVRDVTDERAAAVELQTLQHEYLHVSRVSAMGSIAAALAHELNQPLASVTNYSAAARMLLESRGGDAIADVIPVLEKTSESAQLAGRIVHGLRRMVEKADPKRAPASLRAIIDNVMTLTLAAKPGRASVNMRLAASTDIVLVDQVQVQQVLFNLVRNALEAMSEIPSPWLEISTDDYGADHIVIAVADAGPGLPAGVADRLFMPFATTKDGGMGVGLSICRTIIEGHGGQIWADARDGGTVFRFTLPR